MGAPYGLGDFAGQLTADELQRAYASAGGQPDELDLGALPVRQPEPNPYAIAPLPAAAPQPAPDMHVAPIRGGGVAGYDSQLTGVQNQRIDLAGQGGVENSAMYDRRAELRGEQAGAAKATADEAK